MALFRRSDLQKKIVEKSLKKHLVEDAFVRLSNSDRDFDIFLSHSYLDATEVSALASEIEGLGFSVYVDWIVDQQLDRSKVTKETAETLRRRMAKCKCLFFATSQHSQVSKWMPWELGFFDGKKGKVAILPVVDDLVSHSDRYSGQEYLTLYPYVTIGVNKKNEKTLWINENDDVYVRFPNWLKGEKPIKHDD